MRLAKGTVLMRLAKGTVFMRLVKALVDVLVDRAGARSMEGAGRGWRPGRIGSQPQSPLRSPQ